MADPSGVPVNSQDSSTSAGPGAFSNFPSVQSINQLAQQPPDINVDPKADPATRISQATKQGGVPVFLPDGTAGYVHHSYVQQFLNDNPGSQRGIFMTAPDGTPGRVPVDQAEHLQEQGFKAGLPSQQNAGWDPDASRFASWNNFAAAQQKAVEEGAKTPAGVGIVPYLAKSLLLDTPKAAAQEVGKYIGWEGQDPSNPDWYRNYVAPVGQASADFLASNYDPKQLAMLLALGGASKLNNPLARTALRGLQGYFALQQAHGAYQEGDAAAQAFARGNTAEGVRHLTSGAYNTGMAADITGQTYNDIANNPQAINDIQQITAGPRKVVRTAIDPLADMTPGQIAIRATKATSTIPDIQAKVDLALPYARAGAEKLGIDIDQMGKDPDNPVAHADALAATRQAKVDVWDELENNHLGPAATYIRDMTPVADRIQDVLDGMTDVKKRRNPGLVDQMNRAVTDYDGQQKPVQWMEQRVEELNNELYAEQSRLKVNQDTLRKNPEYGFQFAELDGLRNELNNALDSLTGPGARQLKAVYGGLKTLETIVERSRGVAERPSPEGLFGGLGKLAGVPNILGGGVRTLAGDVHGGVPQLAKGAAEIYMGKRGQQLNNRNHLLGEAFRRSEPAQFPPRQPWLPPTPGATGAVPPTPTARPAPTPLALAPGQYEMPPSSTERPPGPQLALPPAQGVQAPASSLAPQGALPPAPARPQLPGEVGPSALPPQLGTGPRETPRGLLGPARLPESISGERAAREAAAARGTNLPAWANLGTPGRELLASRPLDRIPADQIQPMLNAARNMNSTVDEGDADRAATMHVDDNAHRLLSNLGVGSDLGWRGINLQVEHAQQNVETRLRDLASQIEKVAPKDRAIGKLRNLADQIDRIASLNYDPNAGHAGVPLVHDPVTLQHEAVVHGGQRALAGGQGDIDKFTDIQRTVDHPAVAKAMPKLQQIGAAAPAMAAAEMQAHILDGNHEALGLDRGDAIDFMKHSLDVLAEHHGPDVMENLPRLAQRYVQALREYAGGEGGETGAAATPTEAAQPERAGGANAANAPPSEVAEGAAGSRGGAPRAAGPAPEIAPAEQALASRSLSPEEQDDESWRVSTRNPTGKSTKTRTVENPLTENLQINTQAIRDSDLAVDVANKLRRYPGMNLSGTAESVMSAFVKHAVDNLTWLHNQFPQEWRDQARQWYDGANKLAKQWGDDYGVHKAQVAGVIASQSPQKDWHMNVSLGQRILDTYGKAERGEIEYTPEMAKKAIQLGNKDRDAKLKAADKAEAKGNLEKAENLRGAANNTAKLYKAIQGKSWDELQSDAQRARWIRLYDEAHNPRTYDVYAPDGSVIGPARTDKGNIKKVAWGSNAMIAKAVSILADGSRENISKQLGNAHKIRSFYNNIIAPNSTAGDVTIDTHAVAANLLRALAGSDKPVQHNFGGVGSKMTGVAGAYGLHADAYRMAADQLGLLPRELQSITWEAVRSLFSPTFKRSKGKAIIDKIWREHSANATPIEETRTAIFNAANKFDSPSWAAGGGGSSVAGNEVTGPAPDAGVVSRGGVSGPAPGEAIGGGGSAPAGAVPAVGGRVRQPARRGGGGGLAPSPVPAIFKRVSRR